jgi:hypothetical protein
VHAEIAQRDPARQLVPHPVRGGRREQHLSAMSRRRHPLRTREGERRDVVAVSRFGASRVQAHPDAHGADLAPAFLVQRTLRHQRGGKGIVGVLEYRAETVAQRVEHVATMRAYRILQQHVMAGQRHLHGVRMLLE